MSWLHRIWAYVLPGSARGLTARVPGLSPRAQRALAAAGWTPKRRVSVDRACAELRVAGYDCNPEVEQVLSNIDGLVVTWRRLGATRSSNDVRFDAVAAALSDHRANVADYERRAGTPLCPLALAYRNNANVLIAGDGSVYLSHDQQLWLIGQTIWEALSMMIDDPVDGGVEIEPKWESHLL